MRLFQHRPATGLRLIAVGGALVGGIAVSTLPALAAAVPGDLAARQAVAYQTSGGTAGAGGTASGGATHGSVDTGVPAGTAATDATGPASDAVPTDCTLLDTSDPATAATIAAILSGNPTLANIGDLASTNPNALDEGAANGDPANTLAALPDAATSGCEAAPATEAPAPDTAPTDNASGGESGGGASASSERHDKKQENAG